MALTIDQDKKFMLYIESNQREPGGTSHNFNIIYDVPTVDYDSIVLIDASFPKSYYMTDIDNNVFYVSENNGASFVTITMPIGNYNINSFIAVLKSLLKPPTLTGTYNVTYPDTSLLPDTGQLTYSVTGIATQPIFRVPNKFGINVQLGLDIDNLDPTQFTDIQFTAGSLVSPNTINLQPAKQLYVSLDSCNDGKTNVLQNISNGQVGTMNIVYFQNTNLEACSKAYTKNADNIFHFQIIDEYDNVVDMNGLDWSASILLFKKQTLVPSLNDLIKVIAKKLKDGRDRIIQKVVGSRDTK